MFLIARTNRSTPLIYIMKGQHLLDQVFGQIKFNCNLLIITMWKSCFIGRNEIPTEVFISPKLLRLTNTTFY